MSRLPGGRVHLHRPDRGTNVNNSINLSIHSNPLNNFVRGDQPSPYWNLTFGEPSISASPVVPSLDDLPGSPYTYPPPPLPFSARPSQPTIRTSANSAVRVSNRSGRGRGGRNRGGSNNRNVSSQTFNARAVRGRNQIPYPPTYEQSENAGHDFRGLSQSVVDQISVTGGRD